jgi:hypothetical protein
MTLFRAPVGSLLKGDPLKRRGKVEKQTEPGKDSKHLAFIHLLPCAVSGRRPVEAAHVRFSSKIHGKPQTGIGIKPADRWTVPLHPDEHRAQHAFPKGEAAWWISKGIDPLTLARRLWEDSGDVPAAIKAINDARSVMKEPKNG